MALGTLHLAAIPVVAGLLAGTATAATYMMGSSPVAPTAQTSAATTAPAEQPCANQTWPYISRNCLGSASSEPRRKIRLVAAPSGVEPVVYAAAAEAPGAEPAVADPGLVSSDTVLRQPQRIATTGIETPDRVTQTAKPRVKRASTRHDRRYVAQSYQVPAEGQYRGGADTRPVIVVRPMSVEFVRRCDERSC